ncbi:MAG: DEAD/DEAH box helicase [Saprospiraceae bacterium]|nr:MAG: DEAD/DEAH box helicase [Saprospiraceae bacterium]
MSDFLKLGLSQPLVDAIGELGFIEPTEIQTQAIPKLLSNKTDLVGLAQTGTGKTAAFGLPLMELVDSEQRHTQALILAPTRELCLQISKELASFGKHLRKLKIQAVYGGTDIGKQIRDLRKGAHIITATPGRLRDLIRRGAVDINHIQYLVLDEADEMLNMGFKEEIDDILKSTPSDKLTWLFSATMPEEVRRISQDYMNNPLELSAGQRNTSNVDIDHQYVLTRPHERYEVLRRFLDFYPDMFALVFTRTRRDAKEVAEQLAKDGYQADALHGDLSQNQRDMVMERFRKSRIQILVATDVAARGIDVQDITHVFHYNIPEDQAFYTHRSGRTGRAGSKGVSLVLSHPKDLAILRQIERKLKVSFTLAHIPTGAEICEQQLLTRLRRMKQNEPSEELEAFLPTIYAELEDLSREELIKKIVGISFGKLLKNYHNARDLNNANKGKSGGRKDSRGQRLFINIGTLDVRDTGAFINLICRNSNISGHSIGKIDMHKKYTYFDVESSVVQSIIREFDGSIIDDRPVRVNIDDSRPPSKHKKDKRYDKGRSYGKRRARV